MNRGIATSEFWLSLLHKILSVLLTGGFLTAATAMQWEGIISGAIALVFTILTSYGVVTTYTESRTELKLRSLEQANPGPKTPGPFKVLPFVLLFVLGAPLLASAQQATQSTALLPWRARIEERLRERDKKPPQTDPVLMSLLQQLADNQKALLQALNRPSPPPASTPMVLLHPPYQQIPLGGLPYQTIPLGGLPYQTIPLGGLPYHVIPIGSPPKQDIPLGKPPVLKIDEGIKPKQEIPLENPGKPKSAPIEPMPKVGDPSHSQQYSRVYALYRRGASTGG